VPHSMIAPRWRTPRPVLLFLCAWLGGALVPAGAFAQAMHAHKTQNVVLVVSDGLRWQEVFSGADPLLMNEKNGGIWATEQDLKRKYWRPSPQERRRALFPFLWGTLAVKGQLFGNQAKGSIARVTNGLAFSYPGYNEMLTGHPDPRIDSNEFGPNPNPTVFEWLNAFPELHGHVSVFATWATFNDIFNVKRSHLPVVAGWTLPEQGTPGPAQALLQRLYRTTTRLDDEDVYDAFLQVPLLDAVRSSSTRLLFVGYGETDNWAHQGRYDLVLESAHGFDDFLGELWSTLQALPAYRDRTTLIVTTDHGRGSGPVEWKEHGVEEHGSENIWIGVMGPDTPALGERAQTALVTQSQIAATIAAFFGKDYRHAVPQAGAPITAVLGR